MDIIEAKQYVEVLKSKLRKTTSGKLRSMIIADIMSLESFIHRSGEKDYKASIESFSYEKYKRDIRKDKRNLCLELLDSSKEHKSISNNYVSIFARNDFMPHLFGDFPNIDEDTYSQVFCDFVGSLGDKVYKVYNSLITNEDVVMQDLNIYGGVCWDFPTLDRQVISYNVEEDQYAYNVMAHELGHAVQMKYMNQTGRRRIDINSFCESISSLMELLFRRYLEEHHFDIFTLGHFTLSTTLDFAVCLNATSLMHEKDLPLFNGEELFYTDFDIKQIEDSIDERYKYLYEMFTEDGINFLEGTLYTIGDICSRKIFETSDSPKDAIENMLTFLNLAQLKSHEENIKYLGLDEFKPKSLEEDILKFKMKKL